MIEARELRRSFGRVEAVKSVTLRADDGRITGLLGPNGAGKTTSLRLLCALLQPDGGSILVDGIDARRDPLAARCRLGVLPDQRGLYKRLTARENIEYFGRLNGIDEAVLKQRTDELIASLDMREIEHRQAEGFSQGQRVKTAIARALVHRPQNLMLDEPTNGLDVMSIRALRLFLMQLRAEGRCVIFSSHVMQEVAALCDYIYVISQGRVVAQGTPDELRAQTGKPNLEDAFVQAIGSAEGLLA